MTDLDGKANANRAITRRAVRLESSYKQGEWSEEEKDAQEVTIASGNEAVPCGASSQNPATHIGLQLSSAMTKNA